MKETRCPSKLYNVLIILFQMRSYNWWLAIISNIHIIIILSISVFRERSGRCHGRVTWHVQEVRAMRLGPLHPRLLPQKNIQIHQKYLVSLTGLKLSDNDHFVWICSCSCSGGDVCSLTRDALQQNSFVFYCRPKETSRYRWDHLEHFTSTILHWIF